MDHYEKAVKTLEIMCRIMNDAWKEGYKIDFNIHFDGERFTVNKLEVWQKLKKH